MTQQHNGTVVWRPGGAQGADWPWHDGDEALVAVRLATGQWETGQWQRSSTVWDFHHVRVHCDDGECGLMDNDGSSFDAWCWDDIEWWAKPSEMTFPEPTGPDGRKA